MNAVANIHNIIIASPVMPCGGESRSEKHWFSVASWKDDYEGF